MDHQISGTKVSIYRLHITAVLRLTFNPISLRVLFDLMAGLTVNYVCLYCNIQTNSIVSMCSHLFFLSYASNSFSTHQIISRDAKNIERSIQTSITSQNLLQTWYVNWPINKLHATIKKKVKLHATINHKHDLAEKLHAT